MNALPDRHSPSFPDALKQARVAKNLSYSELARSVGISTVMPSRYENKEHRPFAMPSRETWRKLNEFFSSGEKVEINGLKSFSIDELIDELKRRGASSVQIAF